MRKLLFILFFACSFDVHGDEGQSEAKEFISKQTLNLAEHNNQFAFNLYRYLDEDQNNIFFSPFSISSALAMVFDGARGETKKEMADVLQFNESLNTLNESFSVLNRFFAKSSTDVPSDFRLFIVNSLWVQNGMQILPTFLDNMAKYFKTSIHRVDFFRQKEIARREINYFVKEKTMGKITDLVGESDIDESTKMVLVSSIYMKAKWRNLFDLKKTEMRPFLQMLIRQ